VEAEAKQSTNTQRCQNNHLALKMMPSECLKPEGREREREGEPIQNNNNTKPEQLKSSKTYPSSQYSHKEPTPSMQGIRG
jgi:hypothetical protein